MPNARQARSTSAAPLTATLICTALAAELAAVACRDADMGASRGGGDVDIASGETSGDTGTEFDARPYVSIRMLSRSECVGAAERVLGIVRWDCGFWEELEELDGDASEVDTLFQVPVGTWTLTVVSRAYLSCAQSDTGPLTPGDWYEWEVDEFPFAYDAESRSCQLWPQTN